MAHDKASSWAYAESSATDNSFASRAREAANELGIDALSSASCSFLTVLAGQGNVHTIAEIGTGTGVSGLALLTARPDSQLTTIDVDSEAQQAAREAFLAAGVKSARFRLINGRSADLLPRLATGTYDLVIIDGDPLEAAGDVDEALRMLRAGGLLVVAHALGHDRVADPVKRDEPTVAMRSLVQDLLGREDLHASLIAAGDGFLLATKVA